MLIAQITDTHVVPKGQEWLNMPQTETANRLKLTIEHLNTLNPRPDVVLITGDTVEAGQREAYQHLREILEPLTIPYCVIPGNHDDRELLREAFLDKPYMPRNGFIHYVIDEYPVRLIGLDTNVPKEDYGLLCKERLSWLEQQLKTNTSKPTLLFMHHTPILIGQKCDDSLNCRLEGNFEEIIQSSPQVLGIVAGHLHKLYVTLYGGKTCFIAPSTAPSYHFSSAEDMLVTAIDLTGPSFALHRLMGDSHLVSECNQAIKFDQRLKRIRKEEK